MAEKIEWMSVEQVAQELLGDTVIVEVEKA